MVIRFIVEKFKDFYIRSLSFFLNRDCNKKLEGNSITKPQIYKVLTRLYY